MAMFLVDALNVDDSKNMRGSKTCRYDEVAVCPTCHHALKPKVLSAFFSITDGFFMGQKITQLLLTCFCQRCRKAFLCIYEDGVPTHDYGCDYEFRNLISISPVSANIDIFSSDISMLSPLFVETYSQAVLAEADNLLQICGPGYRKSLEFLVKDYLCWKYPSDAETIKGEFLGVALKRVEDNRIKTLAERAVWIGNDETHYVKKHEALDIDVMKKFIKAILTYIESELSFNEALSIEPER